MVPSPRKRIPPPTIHQAANPGLLPRRLPSRPARLDLRETARLDGRLPLDRRRDPHLGLDLLAQHRGPRGHVTNLLRSRPDRRVRARSLGAVHPGCEVGDDAFPEGDHGGAEDVGKDDGAGGV